MRSTTALKLIIISILSIASITLIILVNRYNTNLIKISEGRILHTQQVLLQSEKTISLLKDLETGVRGYALTKDTNFIDPYQNSLHFFPSIIDSLRKITIDNKQQTDRIDSLGVLVNERLVILRKIIDVIKKENFISDSTVLLIRRGKAVMDKIRVNISKLQAFETSLLKSRIMISSNERNSMNLFFNYILASLSVLFIGTFLSFIYTLQFSNGTTKPLIKIVRNMNIFQNKIEQVINSIDAPFFVLNKSAKFVFINKAAKQKLGFEKFGLTGRNIFKEFTGYNTYETGNKIKEVLKTGNPVNFEVFDEFFERWNDVGIYPIEDGVTVYVQDANERKLNEAELIKTKELLEETNSMARVGGWELDVVKNKSYWSPVTREIHEIDEDYETDLQDGIFFIKEGTSRNAIVNAVENALATGEGWDLELQLITAIGNEKWVRSKGQTIMEKQHCVRMYGSLQDITEKKENELELQKTKQFLEETNEVASIGGWEVDVEKSVVYWSPVTRIIHETAADYTPSLEDGITFYKEGQGRDTIIKSVTEAMQSGRGWDIELQIVTAKGGEKWVRTKGKTEMIDGVCKRVYGSFQDITERKNNELELNRTKLLLEETNHVAKIGGWDIDVLKGTVYWSPVTKEIHETSTDYEPELATAINFYKEGASRDIITKAVESAMKNGSTWDLELQIVTAKGNEKWIRAKGVTEMIDGICKRIYGSFQDITERKNELLKLEQLATIVDFAADAIIRTALDGTILTWNKGARDIFKYDAAAIIGKPFLTLIPESHKNDEFYIQEMIKRGETISQFETVRITGEGDLIVISTTISPIKNEGGAIIGMSRVIRDITAQKIMEKANQEITARLELATSTSGIGIWEFDLINNKVTWDKNMYELYGIESSCSDVYQAWQSCIHADDIANWNEAFQLAIQGTKDFNNEFRKKKSTKDTHYIAARAILNRDEQGNPVSFVGVNWDITELKKAQIKIERERKLLKTLIDNIPMNIYIKDLDFKKILINDYERDYLETTEDEILGKDDTELYPLDSALASLQEDRDVMFYNKIIKNKETYNVKQNGAGTWFLTSKLPLKDADNKTFALLGISYNITERKLAEEQLRLSEESFKGAFEYAAIGMAIVGAKGNWLKVNSAICNMVGYTEAELLQLTFQDITHAEDLNADLGLLNELITGKRNNYQLEKRYIHKQGHLIWIILSVSMVKDSMGNPLHFISQVTNITAEKNAQQQVAETLQQLQGILDAATHVSIIGTDINGNINLFNKGAENLLGYTATEIVNTATPALIHDALEIEKRGQELSLIFNKEITALNVLTQYASLGKYESHEWTYIRKDGSRFPVQVVATAIKDTNGIAGFLSIGSDITNIKNAEVELEKTNVELKKMNVELEQFAFVASHDLQEPLRTITGLISILERKYNSLFDEKGKEYISMIIFGATRMKTLINDILNYSKSGNTDLEKTTVDLNEIVTDIKSFFGKIEGSTKPIIHFNTLPNVSADKTTMQQLFLNLISNGIKYQPFDNVPVIKVDAEEKEAHWLFQIADNGIGIEPEYFKKVFVIFKRLHARSEYEGTGIGLAICKKIINNLNGEIWLSSEKGKGTTFYFTIPK